MAFKFGMKSDTIQFWIMVIAALTIVGTAAKAVDARYEKADDAKEIRWEVHQVYSKVLTPKERDALEKERSQDSQ